MKASHFFIFALLALAIVEPTCSRGGFWRWLKRNLRWVGVGINIFCHFAGCSNIRGGRSLDLAWRAGGGCAFPIKNSTETIKTEDGEVPVYSFTVFPPIQANEKSETSKFGLRVAGGYDDMEGEYINGDQVSKVSVTGLKFSVVGNLTSVAKRFPLPTKSAPVNFQVASSFMTAESLTVDGKVVEWDSKDRQIRELQSDFQADVVKDVRSQIMKMAQGCTVRDFEKIVQQ